MKFKDLPVGSLFTNSIWVKSGVAFRKTADVEYSSGRSDFFNPRFHDIVWVILNPKDSPVGVSNGAPSRYGVPDGEVILLEDYIP